MEGPDICITCYWLADCGCGWLVMQSFLLVRNADNDIYSVASKSVSSPGLERSPNGLLFPWLNSQCSLHRKSLLYWHIERAREGELDLMIIDSQSN